jgi:predicted nucleic acid-binding Zn finger protein
MKSMVTEERLILERVLDEVRSEREISHANWERLRSTFGYRFDRAWRLVQERRVKRYTFHPSGRVIWVVIGQGGEYQVYPNAGYCGCDDFYFRVIDGEAGLCYHLLGQRLAEALESYDSVEEEDEAYSLLTGEWRAQIRSEED